MIVVASSIPSPFGVTAAGSARTRVTASGAARPSVPVAALAPDVAIVHVYEPGAAAVASHVQSTAWLVPVPVADRPSRWRRPP